MVVPERKGRILKTNKLLIPALLKMFQDIDTKAKTFTLKDSVKKKDKFVAANEGKLTRGLKNFWGTQADSISNSEVQKSLNTLTLSEGIESGVISSTALFASMGFKPGFTNVTGAAGEVSASAISKAIGKPFVFDITDPKVVNFIRDEALDLATDLTQSQVSTLRATLSEAIAEGWGNVKTANAMRNNIGLTSKQVGQVFDYRKRLEKIEGLTTSDINRLVSKRIDKSTITRAKTIARTETARAYNGSRDQAAQQAIDSGLVSGGWKIWRTAGDDRVREEHMDMEGERVRIGETFSNGSEYPDDINERCVVEYVLEA
jgi:hypothetical protein